MVNQQRTAVQINLPETEWVLSVYFDVNASTGLWSDKLQRLRVLLDGCEGRIQDKREKHLFQAARRWVEDHISDYGAHGKAVALFYAPELEEGDSVVLQEPLQNAAYFRRGANIEPIARLEVTRPCYAAVFVDNEHGRIVTTHLGEIINSMDVQDDVPKRHKQTEYTSRVERSHATKVQRHLRHVIDVLQRMKKEGAFDYLILGGAAEALPKFEKDLPADLARLVQGHFVSANYVTDSDLARAALKAIAAPKRTAA